MSRITQAGFTLLEVVVAIGISVSIATLSYQALSAASTGAERSAEVMDEINRLDRAWQIIGADLRHVLPPEAGLTEPRFLFVAESLSGDAEARQRLMRFTRRGWINPLERLRSDIQELRYRVEEGRLWRDYRPMRNLPYDEYNFEDEALQQLLLEGVKDIQLRFLSAALINRRGASALEGTEYSRDWAGLWPDPDQQMQGAMQLPLAVEISIELEELGVSTRLFELARGQ
jgi:general secretion pathway protein J